MQNNDLKYTGTATDPHLRRAAYYTSNGIQIAHLSYTQDLNGFELPQNQDWWVNLIDVATINNDASAARERGAEFIIASMHWGTEYQTMPTYYQKRLARAIAATGSVDLLVGHHSHVIQPIERIGDLWVAYGLGNFLSNQPWPRTRDGAILHVEIGDAPEKVAVKSITYTPTWMDRNAMQVVGVASGLLDPALTERGRIILRQSWSRTIKAFHSLGVQYPHIKPTAVLP
jgi:poly-gamma-glutamate synthesis protein (capsule biosynthesis protein)